jgi:LPXTG-motif cell wall-anchored protein
MSALVTTGIESVVVNLQFDPVAMTISASDVVVEGPLTLPAAGGDRSTGLLVSVTLFLLGGLILFARRRPQTTI